MNATNASSPVCVDANVLRGRLPGRPEDREIVALWDEWEREGRRLVAPFLIRHEVSNALHRMIFTRGLAPDLGRDAVRSKARAPLEVSVEDVLHEEAVDFAARFRLQAAYDAHYLALADRLTAEFWTADKKLFNTVTNALPWVRLVGEPGTS